MCCCGTTELVVSLYRSESDHLSLISTIMPRGSRRRRAISPVSTASGRSTPYGVSTRGQRGRSARQPASQTPPPSSAAPRSDSSERRVADLSLEDLISVVRDIVREHRDVAATTAATTSGPVLSDSTPASSVSVSWATPLVTSTIPVAPALPQPAISSGPFEHSGGMCAHM